MMSAAHDNRKHGKEGSGLPARLMHYLKEPNFPRMELYNKVMGRVPVYAKLLAAELRQAKDDFTARQMLEILEKSEMAPDAGQAGNLRYLSGFLPDDGKGPCHRARIGADALGFLFDMAKAAKEENRREFALCRAELEARKTDRSKLFRGDMALLLTAI